jgi:hypothetical protein
MPSSNLKAIVFSLLLVPCFCRQNFDVGKYERKNVSRSGAYKYYVTNGGVEVIKNGGKEGILWLKNNSETNLQIDEKQFNEEIENMKKIENDFPGSTVVLKDSRPEEIVFFKTEEAKETFCKAADDINDPLLNQYRYLYDINDTTGKTNTFCQNVHKYDNTWGVYGYKVKNVPNGRVIKPKSYDCYKDAFIKINKDTLIKLKESLTDVHLKVVGKFCIADYQLVVDVKTGNSYINDPESVTEQGKDCDPSTFVYAWPPRKNPKNSVKDNVELLIKEVEGVMENRREESEKIVIN